jgi:four helix bundle protein
MPKVTSQILKYSNTQILASSNPQILRKYSLFNLINPRIMKQFYFEKLDVWQKGRTLINHVYAASQKFPAEEKFGLTQQIRRACISVNCNIAEGSSRHTGKEQARFTEISYGSLMEVLNLLILSVDLGYVSESYVLSARDLIEEIGNKLNALRETQLKRN